MLNKLRCHAHFWFQAKQITWSGFDTKFTNLMTNSADPDQLASEEANWSGSTLFAKTGHVVFISENAQKMPQTRSTVLLRHQKKKKKIWEEQTIAIQTPHMKPQTHKQRHCCNPLIFSLRRCRISSTWNLRTPIKVKIYNRLASVGAVGARTHRAFF